MSEGQAEAIGSPMSPAMIARVMRLAQPGALVRPRIDHQQRSPFIAWAGAVAIDAGDGLRSPLWIGVALALIALATLPASSVRASRMGSLSNNWPALHRRAIM